MELHYAMHPDGFKTGPNSQSTIHDSILNNGPQLLNFRREHSKEAIRLIV